GVHQGHTPTLGGEPADMAGEPVVRVDEVVVAGTVARPRLHHAMGEGAQLGGQLLLGETLVRARVDVPDEDAGGQFDGGREGGGEGCTESIATRRGCLRCRRSRVGTAGERRPSLPMYWLTWRSSSGCGHGEHGACGPPGLQRRKGALPFPGDLPGSGLCRIITVCRSTVRVGGAYGGGPVAGGRLARWARARSVPWAPWVRGAGGVVDAPWAAGRHGRRWVPLAPLGAVGAVGAVGVGYPPTLVGMTTRPAPFPPARPRPGRGAPVVGTVTRGTTNPN